jgi:hypothetical protein
VVIRFVDIGGIIDHYCLNFNSLGVFPKELNGNSCISYVCIQFFVSEFL